MKRTDFYLYALIAMFFVACSSDDDDTKINLDPNVSDSEVEDISGGVYFSSSLAGEYIFRINLKNGDDSITCDMFYNDKYLELAPAETTWQPGEKLDDLEFFNSTNDIKLILSLDEDGEGEAQIFVEDDEFQAVLFKSTSEQPVKIYTGLSISNYNITDGVPKESYSYRFVMIIKNGLYFAGEKITDENDIDQDYRYTPQMTNFIEMNSSEITFINPDIPDDIENWSWQRVASYNDSTIYSYLLDEYNSEFVLSLERRFKE